MTHLMMYLLCVGLVVVGSLAFIVALQIQRRFRMLLACLAACVPVGFGIWLFQASGLKLTDFPRLLQGANRELSQAASNLHEAHSFRKELDKVLIQR